MPRKICIVTGTRAEYGLLYPLISAIKEEKSWEFKLIATGMHLSPEFGLTYRQIEEDGINIDEKVEMLLSSDTAVGVAKSIGLGTIGFAEALGRIKPDLLIILGDRFEMLAAAQAALVMQIPIAHLHGGENTFGAYDDAIRHSITKMATWHFTSTESHRNRVIQLGENPNTVWNVGAIGIENIVKLELIGKESLYNELQIDPAKKTFLLTFHPETNEPITEIHELLTALDSFEDVNIVFTKANADNGGRMINAAIEKYVAKNKHAILVDSLGFRRYLSAVKYADVVIGNSSSGLIEVPYLETPTVNIGDRQAGRERPNSIFEAKIDAEHIKKAIQEALLFNKDYEHIFGNGNTVEEIMRILIAIPSFSKRKEFYDL